MKKIILIEDRINRQQTVLGENYKEFKSLIEQGIIKNIQGDDFDNIRDSINNSKFDQLLEFDIVMFHRSAFLNETRNKLMYVLKENKKTAVIFSGGISTVELSVKDSFTFLLMNVNDFYDHLLDFLNDDAKDIYKLAFGTNWKINLLYEGIETLSNFIRDLPNEYKKPFGVFETNIPNLYIKETYFKDFINKIIEKKDIELVINKIYDDLNQNI